jgi:hypothetical protein
LRNARLAELLLAVLLTGGLLAFLTYASDKIPEDQTRMEIAELSAALDRFIVDFQQKWLPPSKLLLYEDLRLYTLAPYCDAPAAFNTSLWLLMTFGNDLGTYEPKTHRKVVDWNNDGIIQSNSGWLLEGQQCLVFYLGGMPAPPGAKTLMPQGFLMGKIKPEFGAKVRGPYFPFQPRRLEIQPNCPSFPVYLDPWRSKSGAAKPYAFFSSGGYSNGYKDSECQSIAAYPYYDFSGDRPVYMMADTVQIISAGKDGIFGTTPGLDESLWLSRGIRPPLFIPPPAYNRSGKLACDDDQANFSSGQRLQLTGNRTWQAPGLAPGRGLPKTRLVPWG